MPEEATDAALARTHAWFEVNSGWAPPDLETLGDWAAEGACRAPDECWVELRGTCAHGLVSWRVVLDELEALDAEAGARSGQPVREPGDGRPGGPR